MAPCVVLPGPGAADRPRLHAAIGNCIFWTPSYPQDYCPRNQLLQRAAAAALGADCPRFGMDSKRRLAAYSALQDPTGEKPPAFPMRLWFYPFRLLRAEMPSGA